MNTEKNLENFKFTPFQKFLNALERLGNRLPTPYSMFFVLFSITAIASFLVSLTGIELLNPSNGELVTPNNFFSRDGIVWILQNLVTNFTSYAPLGLVLVMTLGIGLCEEVGLMNAFIKRVMSNVPKNIVPFAVVFVGLFANMASDSSQVVIPPLAAIVYLGVGKHPIAGMLTGYAGASMGYASNFMLSGTDALMSGITQAVLPGVLPEYVMDVTANWYIKIASSVILSIVYGFVSIYFIEPRLGEYKPNGTLGKIDTSEGKVTKKENKALRNTAISLIIFIFIIAVGVFSGLLKTEDGKVIGSPLLTGIIPLIFLLFTITGLTYGISIGVIKREADIPKALTKRMSNMGSYIVMVFMASQFISLFNWSNLGTLLSISGARALESIGLNGIPLIVLFILLTALLDFLIMSGSAKWTIMAPIFVPMFSLLGISPAFTQLGYRVGDAVSNVMSPTNPFLFMMLNEAQQKYDKDIKLGTFLSCQFMFFIAGFIAWSVIVIAWMLLNLPIGPGFSVYL
ncbi:AbgT family transporter [Anaerosphaera multitolerans]|uniref:AbgT family transporter n=1 Tax=Anaerosphaera multitolerans TaxID=2487351 RepID=A0A437S5T2_9FIRM|nr:AbgT family transporter [Anaerosphaera multitolerans]RVU54359.1 AbgT family transporter [Anaerosphaera multitolerans]